MTTAAIEAHGLVKRYGTLTAVAGIDLQVDQGAIFALLGPNGAGKTTTINMLTTLIAPTEGSARVAGFDVVRESDRVRASIGVTFQDIVLDNDLTGRQVLDIHGRLYRQSTEVRRKRIAELVDLVQLGDAIDRITKTYSGGMKRRLELARGLMTDPAILFLDEPTQGLDPQNRVGIWSYLRELNRERGLTLLLTTHYMDEAEALAHRVGIVDHGKLVAAGTPADLTAAMGADMIRLRGQGDIAALAERVRGLAFVSRTEIDAVANSLNIFVDHGPHRLLEVMNTVGGNGFQIEDLGIARPSLGDVFLHYTGRALRD